MSQRINNYTLTVSAVTVKVIGAFFKVPLLRILTDEGMGYFNTAYTVYGFLYLLCSSGVVKGISILLTTKKDDPFYYRFVKRVCLILFFSIGLCFSVLLLLLAFPLSRWIGNKEAAFTLLVMSPSLLFISLAGVVKGILNFRKDFLSIAISDVLESTLKLSLGLFFAWWASKLGLSLPLVSAFSVLGITFGSIVGFIYMYHSIERTDNKNKTNLKNGLYNQNNVIKQLFSITLPITLSAGVNSISHLIDLGMIVNRLQSGGIARSDSIALYGNYTTLVIPFYALAGTIAVSLSFTALPQLCAAKNDKTNFSMLFHSYLSRLMFLIIPTSFGLFFFGKTALLLLFPRVSVEIAAPILKMMAPAMILSATFIYISCVLEAIGAQLYSLIAVFIGVFVKILIGYVLIGNSSVGLKGAAIGTLVSQASMLVLGVVFLFVKTGMCIHPLREFLVPFLLSCPSLILVFWYQSSFQYRETFLQNVFSVFLGAFIYVFIILLLFIKEHPRDEHSKLFILQKTVKKFLAKKTKLSEQIVKKT